MIGWIVGIVVVVMTIYLLFRLGVNKQEDEDNQAGIVRETKMTCKVCGHVWHYNTRDSLNKLTDALADLNSVKTFGQSSNSADLEQCPNCKSRNVTKENVIYHKDSSNTKARLM